jgi:uncharacterized protein YecT (DUF1311 family)
MNDTAPPGRPTGKGPNWTALALAGGLLVLALLFAYFATNRNADQDKLTQANLSAAAGENPEKLCAGKATYDLIKRELFRRAAQLRGSDQAAFDKLAAFAVVRMENPVMESEDGNTGAVHCSGSLSLDLPPGVAVVGGRRTLSADVDYAVEQAADGSGPVVLLRNADAIIAPLATLARASEPAAEPTVPGDGNEAEPVLGDIDVNQSESANKEVGPATAYPGRPSFDCANARTKGEIAVCSDSGLSALDVNMATQYRRALSSASPDQQALLRRTRDRFLGYRDRCPNNACIGEAYTGRMREIRDIMEGRWQPR